MIYIGADHGGFELKNEILKHLKANGLRVTDVGAFVSDPNDNFPDFVRPVIAGVLKDKASGILVCGTGIGVSIAANHTKGIRAALVHNVKYAKLARQHNDANVLCLGGRFIKPETAYKITDAFINTPADPNPKYKNRMNIADGSVQ